MQLQFTIWAALGCYWTALGVSWAALGALGRLLASSWTTLGRLLRGSGRLCVALVRIMLVHVFFMHSVATAAEAPPEITICKGHSSPYISQSTTQKYAKT